MDDHKKRKDVTGRFTLKREKYRAKKIEKGKSGEKKGTIQNSNPGFRLTIRPGRE